MNDDLEDDLELEMEIAPQDARQAARTEAQPGGHAIRVNADGAVIDSWRGDSYATIEQADVYREASTALASVLPQNFPLLTLLKFLPDVRLKQRADALAEKALAIDVRADGGLTRADESLVPIRGVLAEIDACFKDPVSLANQLHKRLTGLRGDFKKDGEGALETVGRRVLDEKRRLERLAEDARRRAQEEADRQARKDAEAAAREAKRRGVDPAIVGAMREQAKFTRAAPVASPLPAPALRSSTVAQNWKARFKGAVPDADPNPDTCDMTVHEQEMFLQLLDAVRGGRVPLTAVRPNWSYLNDQAQGQRTTLDIPGIEAFDAGSLRGKGRR